MFQLLATHGQGVLTSLIRSRSQTSLAALRRPSTARGNQVNEDEEVARPRRSLDDADDSRSTDDRRLSALLMGPQMRSQRLIGNSNPRYRWERYWKTEEELKPMKKPMYACVKDMLWNIG